jgi:hypothetical protein
VASEKVKNELIEYRIKYKEDTIGAELPFGIFLAIPGD